MPVPMVTRATPRSAYHRKRGACIRIGDRGAAAGESATPYWLTLEEAEAVSEELTAAVRREKASRISGLKPPKPPVANAAAMEAA